MAQLAWLGVGNISVIVGFRNGYMLFSVYACQMMSGKSHVLKIKSACTA